MRSGHPKAPKRAIPARIRERQIVKTYAGRYETQVGIARRRRIDPRLGKKSARNLTRASRSPWVTPTFVGAFARNARLQAPAMQRPRLPKPTDCGLTLCRGISKKLSPSLWAASYSRPSRRVGQGAHVSSTSAARREHGIDPRAAPHGQVQRLLKRATAAMPGRSARTDRVLLDHLPVADDRSGSVGLGAGYLGGCVFQARPTRNPRASAKSPRSLALFLALQMPTSIRAVQAGRRCRVCQSGPVRHAVLHLV